MSSVLSFDAAVGYLRQASFHVGEDNILHYASTKDGDTELAYVIEYMQSCDISLDIVDRRCRTALELAIRSDQCSHVEMLLDADEGLALVNEGGQHLLHVAIHAGASQSTCGVLLDYGANPHVQDAQHRSTLELAVLKGLPKLVKLLLDADVSPATANVHGEQPLHVAIRSNASLDICMTLLSDDNDRNFPLTANEQQQHSMALDLVVESLRLCRDGEERPKWYRLLEHLLLCSRHLNPSDKADKNRFRAFLHSLSGLSTAATKATPAAERCLKIFLLKGFSPFEAYNISGPDSVPPECSLLVTYSLLHASENESAIGQIAGYDLAKFGQELFYLLIIASKSQYWPSEAPPVTTFLQALLTRGVNFDQGKNPLSLVLQDFPNSVPGQKTEILESLMKHGRCKLTERSSVFGHPLDQLTLVPEPLRWDLAEIMLSQDEGLTAEPTDAWQRKDYVYVYHPAHEYNQYTTSSFRAILGHTTRSPYILQQCIVHVLSKAMIEGKLPALNAWPPAFRLREALRMRQQMGLPDMAISVDNALLLSLLEGQASSPQKSAETWRQHNMHFQLDNSPPYGSIYF